MLDVFILLALCGKRSRRNVLDLHIGLTRNTVTFRVTAARAREIKLDHPPDAAKKNMRLAVPLVGRFPNAIKCFVQLSLGNIASAGYFVTVMNLCALVDPGRSFGRSVGMVGRFGHLERSPYCLASCEMWNCFLSKL